MSLYHAKDGLHFQRHKDGSVTVARWLHGLANAGRADQAVVDVLDHAWTLTASEWASVVASVSAKGESGETYNAALRFHDNADEADAVPVCARCRKEWQAGHLCLPEATS